MKHISGAETVDNIHIHGDWVSIFIHRNSRDKGCFVGRTSATLSSMALTELIQEI